MSKEGLKNWLKDRHNLIFVAIMIFALVLGGYYFSVTSDQALWWDEADYLAYAKNIAGENVNWVVTAVHSSLFPLVAGVLFGIGF